MSNLQYSFRYDILTKKEFMIYQTGLSVALMEYSVQTNPLFKTVYLLKVLAIFLKWNTPLWYHAML